MRFLPNLIYSICLFLSFNVTAQLEGKNWQFGNGNTLTFEGSGPALYGSSINAALDRTPASISSASGQLLFYADQSNVYAANGSVLPGGTFNNQAFECIFLPRPGNPNQYYLFRSRGSAGMYYTILDFTLNGGVGGIVPGSQEVSFFSIGGELMAIKKGEGTGYWLISADNNNGSENCLIRTFDVNENGIWLHEEYEHSWLWVGFNSELDDAEISQDCSKIAVSFKGHYIGLFTYDNIIGNCTSALASPVNNYGGFFNLTEMAFSQNSQYLYAISDFNNLDRFDVSDLNQLQIQTSQVEVQTSNTSSWRDLKLGIDGNIYILDTEGFIHRIINADDESATFESNVIVTNGNLTTYFPNTPNLFCGQPILISPQVTETCLGDPTNFSLGANFSPDSVLWNFGYPAAGDLNFSNDAAPQFTYPSEGSYNVQLYTWYQGELLTFDLVAQIYVYPTIDLGADQSICAGESLLLSPGIAENYLWSTGAETPVITISTPGVYSVLASNGICSVTDQMELTVIEQPTVSLGNDIVVCNEPSATISAGQPVNWSNGAFNEEITVFESGWYTATSQNECFTVLDSILVTLVQVPANDLPTEITACQGDTITLSVGIPTVQAIWQNTTEEDDGYTVTNSGIFTVEYNYQGCWAYDTVVVNFTPFVNLDLITMPNIFSPNGDAINDLFQPIDLYTNTDVCIHPSIDIQMNVYNRWGAIIAENTCNWNGKNIDQNDVVEGVYYYIIDLSSNCNARTQKIQFSGGVTLTR